VVSIHRISQLTSAAKWPTLHLNPDDKHDLMMDVMAQVVTPQTVRACRKEDDPIKYFGGMFNMRILTALKNLMGREKKHLHQPAGDDRDKAEWIDSQTQGTDPHHEIEYSQLVKGLRAYLLKQPQSKYFGPIFDCLLRGDKNNEVAAKLGVSAPIITRNLQLMKVAMLEYAKQTKNATLQTLITQIFNQRKHSQHTADRDWDDLVNLFKKYKTKVGADEVAGDHAVIEHYNEEQEVRDKADPDPQDETTDDALRSPTGKVQTVRVSKQPDALDEDYVGRLLLSDKVSSETVEKSAKEFLAWQGKQDDLIEHEGHLIGLSIQGDDVRAQGKAAESKSASHKFSNVCDDISCEPQSRLPGAIQDQQVNIPATAAVTRQLMAEITTLASRHSVDLTAMHASNGHVALRVKGLRAQLESFTNEFRRVQLAAAPGQRVAARGLPLVSQTPDGLPTNYTFAFTAGKLRDAGIWNQIAAAAKHHGLTVSAEIEDRGVAHRYTAKVRGTRQSIARFREDTETFLLRLIKAV
jgi:hypothetical protein